MPTQVATITKAELENKINAKEPIQIVNVLAPEHYALGMIPGSMKIPLADLDRRFTELNKHKEIIVYCAGGECMASRQAAEKLADLGFRVRAYEGGIKEWTGKTSSPPTVNEDTHALREQVLEPGHMFSDR